MCCACWNRGIADGLAVPRWRLERQGPLWRSVVPDLRIHLLPRRPLLEWVFVACFVVYGGICLFIYFHYVEPWIATGSGSRYGADSDHYWEQAMPGGETPLIGLTGNLLGPILLIRLLHTGFAILCFNFVILLISLKVAGTIPQVNKAVFGLLLLANAEMIPALTTVNKEIFVVLAGG